MKVYNLRMSLGLLVHIYILAISAEAFSLNSDKYQKIDKD